MTETVDEPPEREKNPNPPSGTPAKPLARSRSTTPADGEPSRKRHRADSRSASLDDLKGAMKSGTSHCARDQFVTEDDHQRSGASNSSKPGQGEEDDRAEREEEEEEEGELPPLSPRQKVTDDGSADGWEAIWEPNVGAYYFYNHKTSETTWTNPRVPPTDEEVSKSDKKEPRPSASSVPYTGYDPSIHGDYDPTAAYAQGPERTPSPSLDPYAAHAAFNRFTGKFQNGPDTEKYSDESRARRQMEIFFDVDAAANCHDGRSLKAERQAKKLTKKEVKAFREKTRLKKEEKKRAWLRD